MKKLTLALLLASSAIYADPTLCDQWGASPNDPVRPADAVYRHYHDLRDIDGLRAAIDACTAAYEDSGDVRYLYQRGAIRMAYAIDAELSTIFAQEKPTGMLQGLRRQGLQQSARGDLKAAADKGYAIARYNLAMLDVNKAVSAAAMEAQLPKDAPLLFHSGMAVWYVMQADIEGDKREAYLQEGRQHNDAALAAAGSTPLPHFIKRRYQNDRAAHIAALRTAIGQSDHPALRGDLAVALYESGGDGAAVLADIPETPDGAVEKDFINGMRYLNGWGVEKDEAQAVVLLSKAAQHGHGLARNTLLAMQKTW